MECQRCNSDRVMEISSKCSDCFGFCIYNSGWETGYVCPDLGIGGGDYVEFSYCLECGQIQGKFPLPITDKECRR